MKLLEEQVCKSVDSICKTGDRARESQAAGVYEAVGFTAESPARIEVRDGMWRQGIKVHSDKDVIDIGRIAVCDRG
jgi:hypothetical protein